MNPGSTPLQPPADTMGLHGSRRSGGTGRRAGLKIQWGSAPCGFDPRLRHPSSPPRHGRSRPINPAGYDQTDDPAQPKLGNEQARCTPHGGRRLPGAERGHPGGHTQIARPRVRGRRRPRGVARARRGKAPALGRPGHLGDPPARRHHPRDVAHEPLQAGRRRRARARARGVRAPRRARRRRGRGHARRCVTPLRGAGVPGRRRSEDDRQRPLGDRLHLRLRHGRDRSPRRRSTGCTRRRSRTTASWSSR